MKEFPLIVIVGPTASGKTSLGIKLAKKYGGEIVCADSRTVYNGMDVGTAKPSSAERAVVPHWGLDLVSPDQSFSAAEFKRYAVDKIAEIRSRGNIPFLVGGTGLYIDAVVFDYDFGAKADPTLRKALERQSLGELHEYCTQNNIPIPENSQNKRYVIRAIERNGRPDSKRATPIENSIIVGIATDKNELLSRIRMRTDHIFNNNVADEALVLSRRYGWQSEAMTANIYKILHAYLEGTLTLDQAKEKFTTADWHLAKRQMTWLRRNPYVKWTPLGKAEALIEGLLATE